MRALGFFIRFVVKTVLALAALVFAVPVLLFAAWHFMKEPEPAGPPQLSSENGAEAPAVRTVEPPPVPEIASVPPPAPEPEPVDTTLRADEAARAVFPDDGYLVETSTPSKPESCDGRFEAVLWTRLHDRIRSEFERDTFETGEVLAGFLTFGLTAFTGPGNERWTVFSIEKSGPWITILLGATRTSWADDRVGPQYRLTLYEIDGRRLGRVEWAPVDTPSPPRGDGRPRFEEVYLRCVYRSDVSDEP